MNMFRPTHIAWLAALAVALLPSAAAAQQRPTEAPIHPQQQLLKKIHIEQRLGERAPLDAPFVDSTGRAVQLGDVLGDRPVILALVYHECPKLCNQVLHGLMTALRGIDYTAGKDFDVLVVSFDPRETPKLAAGRKQGFVRLYDREGTADGFHFLTGEEDSIRKLTEAVGFNYAWDDRSAQYAHASAIMVLAPDGTISKYFYGIDYNTRDLRFGLVDASAGKVGTLADAILLLCFHYDPTTGKYGLIISRVIQLGGVLTVLCLGTFIFISLRSERRRAAQQSQEAAAAN